MHDLPEGQVVVSDDGKVARHFEAEPPRGADTGDGHGVVAEEDRRRTLFGRFGEAGAAPDVSVADPRVLVGRMSHEDGRQFVWFVSQHDEPLTAEPETAGRTLTGLDGGQLEKVELPPFGVVVAELSA